MVRGHFFIATPLQYICALEARAYYRNKLDSANLIIISELPNTLYQLETIVDKTEWNSIERLNSKKVKNKYLNYIVKIFSNKIFLKKMFINIKVKDYLFIGNINIPIFQWIISSVNATNKIVLDDGLSTLTFLKKKERYRHQPHDIRSAIDFLNYQIKKISFKDLTFFSLYIKDNNGNINFIENNFEKTKAIYARSQYNKSLLVYFIGQPLGKLNIISQEYYIKLIELTRIFHQKNGFYFRYVSHRAEATDLLPKEWNALEFDEPIELNLLKAQFLPRIITSFYSSAIINLKKIFGNKIKYQIIPIPPSEINKKYRSSLMDIYEYLFNEIDRRWLAKDLTTISDELRCSYSSLPICNRSKGKACPPPISYDSSIIL